MISSKSIALLNNIFPIPIIHRHAITRNTFGKAYWIKAIIRAVHGARGQLIMTPLIKNLQILKLGNLAPMGVNLASDEKYHSSFLFVNLRAALNKRKLHRSQSHPIRFQDVNSYATVASSIQEPLDIMTSRWPIVPTRFLDFFQLQFRVSAATQRPHTLMLWCDPALTTPTSNTSWSIPITLVQVMAWCRQAMELMLTQIYVAIRQNMVHSE